ncbi:MAG: hypothetical protein D3906_11460 [Candidatus Electrothrix sp. AUS1_2]|nr:hypothetical protein [Candidatus Electrothrix sp. AUS1_2]
MLNPSSFNRLGKHSSTPLGVLISAGTLSEVEGHIPHHFYNASAVKNSGCLITLFGFFTERCIIITQYILSDAIFLLKNNG